MLLCGLALGCRRWAGRAKAVVYAHIGDSCGESRGVVEEGQRVVEVDLGAGAHCRGGPWGKILVVGSGIVRGSSVDS